MAKPENVVLSADLKPEDHLRRGSAGVAESMKLLKSYQSMHVPYTQDAPLMTEDMHEERLQAVEAFGDSFDFSAQLEKEILSSDMSAFKAANPDAVFEDFIRWHSPGDWENGIEGSESSKSFAEDNWPPQGRLSKRMSEQGNMWRNIWNDAHALPASEQKPLLDPNREGEKILHYLETVRPHQLLEQMVCTAFRASADTLNQTSYGDLKQMATKMDQLYLTIASVLKSLQANCFSPGSEIIEDLRQLSGVFEHVEKLLTLAASLHRKFLQAPRLSEAIFSDCYNFYLPRMGTASASGNVQKEFDKKQEVRVRERSVVSNMFTHPTANQSWRKVLSMGNLLNGHEPILREIIFLMRDGVKGNHYASRTSGLHLQEIETYRMYICGTSNDLRVALSVTSCD
ncbi:Rab3 GTPase-activating protein catalytic subunit [Parasponia andersonii]|uniref:Rab3 GTPase-activating protein catalytic subunit n=1 Tax=Parasponia andersonii TaxID=3476 RepID=A0A2P5CFQ8_PARAD|nr:Rab3 GTPase-activating protein catalytic subunit [Parasponia andersonii]